MSMEPSAASKARYLFSITEKRKRLSGPIPRRRGNETNAPRLPRGVMGITPAVTGSIEATEVLKIICGFGEVLSGKLWTIDLRTLQSNKFSL